VSLTSKASCANTIIAKMTDAFAGQPGPPSRYGANQGALAERISETLKPSFTEYGLPWTVLWSTIFPLPEELAEGTRPAHQHRTCLVTWASSRNISGASHPHPPPEMKGGGAVGMGAGLGAGGPWARR